MNKQFEPVVLKGSGGAPGIVVGPAFVYTPRPAAALLPETPADVQTVMALLKRVQHEVATRLTQRAAALLTQGQQREAAIFEAHAALVHDTALSNRVARYVHGGVTLPLAIEGAVAEMTTILDSLDDAHLRDRAADVRAIGEMLRSALQGGPRWVDAITPGCVVVAADLTPADAFDLHAAQVAGFATAYGGPNGHTAILARSLGIPAVVGLGAAVLTVKAETPLLLDGTLFALTVAPGNELRQQAEQRRVALEMGRVAFLQGERKPGALRDGARVALRANIGRPEELQAALDAGAEGVGLFRSEFLFFDRPTPPSEEEQVAAYGAALRALAPHPVVIRTLDVGGDKPLPYQVSPRETNPALGMRGLRHCMRYPELFHTQLRALLCAAMQGDLWIMLPMIASVQDVEWARSALYAASRSLAAEGVAHQPDVRLGIMVEIPAAVAIADLLARACDFFSIGSNDLAQYALAADRGDGLLAAAYPASSPAVLRLVAQTAAAAHAVGISVSLCGELAADPHIAPGLVGLGVGELSMTPVALPAVRERIAATTLAEAEALGRQLCAWA